MNELEAPIEASLVKLESPGAVETTPDLAHILQAVVEKGVTTENVAAVEKICSLYERMEGVKSERAFSSAFVQLQKETRKIKAMTSVTVDGVVRYKFANKDQIMDEVQPLLDKFGFAVSKSQKADEKRVTMFITVIHLGGHKVTTEYSNRISKIPGCNDWQNDAGASEAAERNAICDAFNIRIDKSITAGDARNEGANITPDQAKSLRERVHATGSDEQRFLKFAQAPTFEEIKTSMFSTLDDNLRRREKVS